MRAPISKRRELLEAHLAERGLLLIIWTAQLEPGHTGLRACQFKRAAESDGLPVSPPGTPS
jgi:hypothetical protein